MGAKVRNMASKPAYHALFVAAVPGRIRHMARIHLTQRTDPRLAAKRTVATFSHHKLPDAIRVEHLFDCA
ncbi:hypothetical protein [Lysobacter tyrosinilyticus]